VPAAPHDRPMTQLIAMMAGLIAWAVQFTVIYGVTSVACARGYADLAVLGVGLVPFAILVTTAAALAATGWVFAAALARHRRMTDSAHPTDRFLAYSTLLISGLSLVTIAWHGLPALIVPPCW
jgi:hypothetical protein